MLNFGNAPKELGKYAFEFERIGFSDPANVLTHIRVQHLTDSLEARQAELDINFIVDYASWRAVNPAHHIYPRNLYYPGVEGGSPLTFCGNKESGGKITTCDACPLRLEKTSVLASNGLLHTAVGEIVQKHFAKLSP